METQGSQFSSLQCKHCGNEITAGMNFCGNCGQAIPVESSQTTSAPVNFGEQVKYKVVKTSKIVLGLILGLIIFAIAFKVIFILVTVIGALGLGAIGIHVAENPGAHNDLESFANILSFIGGAYLFYKIYKRVT